MRHLAKKGNELILSLTYIRPRATVQCLIPQPHLLRSCYILKRKRLAPHAHPCNTHPFLVKESFGALIGGDARPLLVAFWIIVVVVNVRRCVRGWRTFTWSVRSTLVDPLRPKLSPLLRGLSQPSVSASMRWLRCLNRFYSNIERRPPAGIHIQWGFQLCGRLEKLY